MKKITNLFLALMLLVTGFTGADAIGKRLKRRLRNLTPNAATLRVKGDRENNFSDNNKGGNFVFELNNAAEGQELGDAGTSYREIDNNDSGVQINLPQSIEEGSSITVTPVTGEGAEDLDTDQVVEFEITKLKFDDEGNLVKLVAVRRKSDLNPDANRRRNKVASKVVILFNKVEEANDDEDSEDELPQGVQISNLGAINTNPIDLGGLSNQNITAELLAFINNFDVAYVFDDEIPIGEVVATAKVTSKEEGDNACGDSVQVTTLDGEDEIPLVKNEDETFSAQVSVQSSENPSTEASCETTVTVTFLRNARVTNNTETSETNVNAGDFAENQMFFRNGDI